MEFILVGEPGYEYRHVVGNADCKVGWCDISGFPSPCKCGGLIHASFGDESYESYWLWQKCDRCGDDYEFRDRYTDADEDRTVT